MLPIWHVTVMRFDCPPFDSDHVVCVLTQTAMRLFKVISPVYTWLFVLVRTCMGPPIIGWLAKRLVLEATKVPVGLRLAAFLVCILDRLPAPW